MILTPTQTYWRDRPVVYRMYDADERLLYIGATKNIPQRMYAHERETWWLSLVVRTRLQLFPTRDAALAAEMVAIQEEDPVFNRAHTARAIDDYSHWTLDDLRAFKAWRNAGGSTGSCHFPWSGNEPRWETA